MSKAKFAAAKELIDEKQYDSARTILKTIDHPTAREWEKKIDAIAPVSSSGSKYTRNILKLLTAALLTLVFVIVILFFVQKMNSDIAPSQQAASDALRTVNSPNTPDIRTTNTALAVAIKETVSFLTTENAPTARVITATAPAILPTVLLSLTPSPTFTVVSPTNTPEKLAFSGTNAKVIGPLDIPEGIYRAVFTTTGFGGVTLSPTKGDCGADLSGMTIPLLFNVMSGQAASGAEAILKSNGCTTLVQISNVTAAWTLNIDLAG